MLIITTNVNGVRSAEKKGFFTWLNKKNADIVCLQEIKAQEEQLDDSFYPKKYHCYYHPAKRKGYSGTAIFTKIKANKIIKTSPWTNINIEGRFIRADFDNLSVISIYIYSGSSKQQRQNLKIKFLNEDLMPYLRKLAKDGGNYIICGDINIVHKKHDIKNFSSNKNRSGCLPEERKWLDELFFEVGFIDAFREVNSSYEQYTWWSNRGEAWKNNTGWRIDYQILSPNLKNIVKNATIYKDERFSDHAPLVIDYKL